MKRIPILLFTLSFFVFALTVDLPVSAQKKENKKKPLQKSWPEETEIEIGKTTSGQPVKATIINFVDYYISHYYKDTVRHEIFFTMQEPRREKGLKYEGKMGAFDPHAKKFIWVKDLKGDKFNHCIPIII